MPARQSKVKCFVRTRPTENIAKEMIDFGPDGKSINIYNKRPVSQGYVNNQITDWSFKVDGILHNVSQDAVYDDVVRDVTKNCLDGYNGTILCYGQTGAGKTFTMTGATENYQQRGLIPRTLQHLYKELQNRQDHEFTIRIGYLEIYNEQLFDLLTPSDSMNNQMSVFDDRGDVFVKGLSYMLANTEEDALNLLFEGETNRAIGQHILNKVSSRSHCIFTIRIESKSISASHEKYTLSKLNLVDLAGSERLAKTQSQGITQKEAQYINKSLSFLEQAVIGLSDPKKSFVQFRQCKLTHVLKDSIGGNCMTTLIANIWPEARHIEETVSTLRFASRMMNVTVEPAINEIVDPMRMMQKLDNEVKTLRQELAMHDTLVNRRNPGYEPLSEHQLLEIENNCRRFIDGSVDEIEIQNIRQIQATFSAFRRICKRMERDVENRLRERFTMIDKTDAEQIAEAQKAGLPIADDGSLVGETDGQGFGIGVAPKDMRASKTDLLKATKAKRIGKASGKVASPPLEQRVPQKSTKEFSSELSKENLKKDLAKETTTPAKEPSRPSTPPARAAAFEEFKQERGNEINRILNENKDILASKRRQYSDIAHRINDTKGKIDQTRIEVERKRTERITLGEFVNEYGETVIDEEEFTLIKTLQDLKSRYRDDYEKWRDLKSEIAYCQNLVEQCRQRLLQEFEHWYNEMYTINPPSAAAAATPSNARILNTAQRPYEDAAEKFQRMQKEILLTDIDSVPYRSARMRTDRRHTYEQAMSQPQASFIQSRQPGTPVRYVNNPPPGKLTVS